MFTRRLAKWIVIISKFDIQYVKRKAIKGQAIADQLVEFPLQDNAPMQIDFLDASIIYAIERTWKYSSMAHTPRMELV